MAKETVLRVRLTASQMNRIKELSTVLGYSSVSDYVRDLSLNKGFWFEERVKEIYNMLVSLHHILNEKK